MVDIRTAIAAIDGTLPASDQGSVNDIAIASDDATQGIYRKTNATTWTQIGGGTYRYSLSGINNAAFQLLSGSSGITNFSLTNAGLVLPHHTACIIQIKSSGGTNRHWFGSLAAYQSQMQRMTFAEFNFAGIWSGSGTPPDPYAVNLSAGTATHSVDAVMFGFFAN